MDSQLRPAQVRDVDLGRRDGISLAHPAFLVADLWAGQSVALARQSRPAAQIVADLVSRL
jgi:hypothetical protein